MLPADLPIVIKFGLKLDAPELLTAAARDNQILDDQVRAIVAAVIAIDADFGRLVVLLAAALAASPGRADAVGAGGPRPWALSSAMLRPFQRAVEEAGLPLSTIPYALRHSSIVRGLRAGLPIRLVAALHDTSVAMIERHYSRYITEGSTSW